MATLTIVVNSALGTNTTTLTFSGPDASRMFTAWKNKVGPKDSLGVSNGTQANFVSWLASSTKDQLYHFVTMNEQQAVVSPPMTSADS